LRTAVNNDIRQNSSRKSSSKRSGNHATTVNRLITMDDKAAGKEKQQTGANIRVERGL